MKSTDYTLQSSYTLQRCNECHTLTGIAINLTDHTACCPNCNAVLQAAHRWSLKRCTIIAVSILILLPFALLFPLMSIDLLGVKIHASVWEGVWKMATAGFPYTAFMILLCSVIMPFAFVLLVITLGIQKWFDHRPYYSLRLLGKIKQWVMLDVYLVALAVAAFKVREYASLEFDIYLLPFVLTTLLTTLLFIKIDTKQLWKTFYPEYSEYTEISLNHASNLALCHECGYTFEPSIAKEKGKEPTHCPRCTSKLNISDNIKLQRVWATLIAGTIMMFPANILPISSTEFAGTTSADSLISGVLLFLEMGSYTVAAIVFIASIAVPVSKIAVILYLLLAIHYQWKHNIHWQMKLLHYVHFVGRWSMLDLFVLALMMSLVERGQIINFSVGDAAFYFGAAVFLTMIASTNLDAKMLWKIHQNRIK